MIQYLVATTQWPLRGPDPLCGGYDTENLKRVLIHYLVATKQRSLRGPDPLPGGYDTAALDWVLSDPEGKAAAAGGPVAAKVVSTASNN